METNLTFREVDDALYAHETPFYRYCASGAGSNPTESPQWIAERARLTELWNKLCPFGKKQAILCR